MRSSWSKGLLAPTIRTLTVGVGVAALARPPGLQAQRPSDVGVVGVVTAGRTTQAVAGAAIALRPSSRLRIEALAGAGARADHAAWRGELSGHFLLRPRGRVGIGAYLGGGVAVDGNPTAGYAQLVVGLESAPGGPGGWLLELGVGGGVRVALGYRWRPGRLTPRR